MISVWEHPKMPRLLRYLWRRANNMRIETDCETGEWIIPGDMVTGETENEESVTGLLVAGRLAGWCMVAESPTSWCRVDASSLKRVRDDKGAGSR